MLSSPAGLCLTQRCLFNDSYVCGVQENTSVLFRIVMIKVLAQKLTPKITMVQMIKAHKVAPGVYLLPCGTLETRIAGGETNMLTLVTEM